jgi:hypothetical protein
MSMINEFSQEQLVIKAKQGYKRSSDVTGSITFDEKFKLTTKKNLLIARNNPLTALIPCASKI